MHHLDISAGFPSAWSVSAMIPLLDNMLRSSSRSSRRRAISSGSLECALGRLGSVVAEDDLHATTSRTSLQGQPQPDGVHLTFGYAGVRHDSRREL
jgi:hypothetical protein